MKSDKSKKTFREETMVVFLITTILSLIAYTNFHSFDHLSKFTSIRPLINNSDWDLLVSTAETLTEQKKISSFFLYEKVFAYPFDSPLSATAKTSITK